jgi:hypothetical protein
MKKEKWLTYLDEDSLSLVGELSENDWIALAASAGDEYREFVGSARQVQRLRRLKLIDKSSGQGDLPAGLFKLTDIGARVAECLYQAKQDHLRALEKEYAKK